MLWPPFQVASLFGKGQNDHPLISSVDKHKKVAHHCAFVHIDEVPPTFAWNRCDDKHNGVDDDDDDDDDSDCVPEKTRVCDGKVDVKKKNTTSEKNTNLTERNTELTLQSVERMSRRHFVSSSFPCHNVSCDNLNHNDTIGIGKTPIRSNSTKRNPIHRVHGTTDCSTFRNRLVLDCDDQIITKDDENGDNSRKRNHGNCDTSTWSPPRIQSMVKKFEDGGQARWQQKNDDQLVRSYRNKGHCDYIDMDDEDSFLCSLDTDMVGESPSGVGQDQPEEKKESYEKMFITIEKMNGIISFASVPFDRGVDEGGDNHQLRNGRQPLDETNHHECIQDNHVNDKGQNERNMNQCDSCLAQPKGPTFQLMPTKHQSHKEYKRKLYHQTRKACLEAAVEAYKSASKDIPDMILAQLNDHRNYLSGNKINSIRYEAEKKCSHIRHEIATQIISSEHCNVKMIKLHKTDEIHVAPCQCALRLLGMENQSKRGDPSQLVAAQLKTKTIGRKDGHLLQNIEEDDNDPFTGEFRHSRTASTINDDHPVTKFIGNYKNAANNMVRTSSAQVTSSLESERNMRNQSSSKDMKSKANAGNHSRPESNVFNFSELHEITLIRNHNLTSFGNETSKCTYSDDGFLQWDAVTIRCSNHDELDLLVKELRDSSKAKVVPFSSNPKYRLKWIQAQRGRIEKNTIENNTSRSKQSVSHNKERIHGPILGIAEKIMACENKSPICENQIDQDSSFSTPAPSCMDTVSKTSACNTPEIQGGCQRKPFDLNFNKMEFCELCDLTFTLLTRRHHCRKCERSCCGHCSRILIVKGCDEKRYCNWCASDILQKQSYALRGRFLPKDQDNFLPGKVHGACFRLGVGLTGRLPHWKAFLRPNLEDRPAVGRITIEVIEAIALPSVDMVNGKVDPYVRATITGYDRDMKWTLRQWLQSYRYSLCSRFCSATLSPQWRGTGKLGGELLTLPVISTAGAVLRLEVLHYNVLTTSRDKDPVLGVVEIPLSDLPNANLRHPGGIEVETSTGKKKNLKFDGYCDRWYRLLPSEEFDSKYIMLSKPILSPIDAKTSEEQGNRKVGMQSLEEVGKRMLGLAIAPVEWFASAIKLDLPARRPEAICRQHKARSMIHVRLKLNASIVGDVLSHAWFPPVRPYPLPPPYDPEILLSRILQVGRQTEPYRNIIQYFELCIKWKHPPKVCILSYVIFGFHVAIFPYLLPLFHVYLFAFLWIRLRKMKFNHEDDEILHSLQCHESFDGLGNCQKGGNKKYVREQDETSDDCAKIKKAVPLPVSSSGEGEERDSSERIEETVTIHNSPSLIGLSYQRKEGWRNRGVMAKTKLIQSSSNTSLADSRDRFHGSRNITDDSLEEEVTKLNIAIHWIAKRLGDNKGLEVLQFKLGMLGRDLRNLNSVWNGKNPFLTRATMAYLVISFLLHFLVNQRLLWLLGTSTWYFAQAPFCVLIARFIFGLSRGIAKVMRRQQLLDAELLSNISGNL